VKVDVIGDFDAIGDALEFMTSTILVSGRSSASFEGRTTIQFSVKYKLN